MFEKIKALFKDTRKDLEVKPLHEDDSGEKVWGEIYVVYLYGTGDDTTEYGREYVRPALINEDYIQHGQAKVDILLSEDGLDTYDEFIQSADRMLAEETDEPISEYSADQYEHPHPDELETVSVSECARCGGDIDRTIELPDGTEFPAGMCQTCKKNQTINNLESGEESTYDEQIIGNGERVK